MTHPLRRTVVALATACAVLFSLATPASATVYTLTATITNGTVTFTPTGIVALTGGPCGTTPTTQLSINDNVGTIGITALAAQTVATLGGTDYVVEVGIALAGSPGGYDVGPPATIGNAPDADIQLRMKLSFWALASAPCTKGALLCQVAVQVLLDGGYGGNPIAPAVNDTFSIGGFSTGVHTVGFPTCASGPAGILGDTVAVSNFTGTVTSVV